MDRNGIVAWILLAFWLFFATQVEAGPGSWTKNDPKNALTLSLIKMLH